MPAKPSTDDRETTEPIREVARAPKPRKRHDALGQEPTDSRGLPLADLPDAATGRAVRLG